MPVTRGFKGKLRGDGANRERIPPGQFVTPDFPVLTAGPTQHIATDRWSLSVLHGDTALGAWSWEQFAALPQTEISADIHCVTKWTKFDTRWRGVTIDDLLRAAGAEVPPTRFLMAHCDGGYTTNLRLADLLDAKAMVATHFDGVPITASHGGPARLLVPHLYFWKSAKWVRQLVFRDDETPGFWEALGYHIRGDPWQEQRYEGDR